jgi:hypothetical protein
MQYDVGNSGEVPSKFQPDKEHAFQERDPVTGPNPS